MKHIIDPKVLRQILTLIVIVVTAFFIGIELLPYLSGGLGAITIYVLFKGSFQKLVKKGWRKSLAASFLMFLSFILMILPLVGIFLLLKNKIKHAAQNSHAFLEAIQKHIVSFEDKIGYDVLENIDSSGIKEGVASSLESFASGSFNAFISIFIMYMILYYKFTDPVNFRKTVMMFLPFNKEDLNILLKESKQKVYSNAIGIPLVAIGQGLVALIGFLIFGIEQPLFWAVIVTIGSVIPFVGTLIGILPVFIITLASGHDAQAWGILIYGAVVVGLTDNVLRIYILNKLDEVHPLITLIGVIIGIPLFGFIGLIFGPLFISLFFLVLKIYKKEYGEGERA